MTNRNRRQLAGVRNAFLGATALAGFAALSTPAAAIVINDNYTPADVVDTTNVTGVGQMVIDEQNGFIGLCTVSLINPRTVIFASHCVNENADENAFQPGTAYGAKFGGSPIGFFFNANNNAAGNSAIGHWLSGVAGGPAYQTDVANHAYNSNFVVYDTNCCTIGVGNNFLQSDIAMAALDTPALDIPTWTLLFSPLTAPAHATIVGYGDNGIGTNGQGSIDFKRRVAENVVSVLGSLDDQDAALFGNPDGLPANLYMMDFNDPKFNTADANVFDFNIFHDTAYDKEGITAPGDSGGPLIIDNTFASPTIAAVLSGGDRFYGSAQPGSSYGTTSFYQPLYLYWDWIVANNPYKYVTNTGGDHSWTDIDAFKMALDPAYLTVDGNGNTINALPTTAALGEADVPAGFGEVCYYDDCINIVTGVENKHSPAPGPNPAGGPPSDSQPVAGSGSRPFGGGLGIEGFRALVQSFIAANGGQDCGAAQVSVAALNSGDLSAVQSACPAAGGGGGASASASAQSDWTNPEGFAHVGDDVNGEDVQGAPGASPGRVVDNTDGDPTTGAPARYYDVTLSADGTTTLSGADITVDKLTINGAATGLTIAAGASLTTNIVTQTFAGDLKVNGVLNSPNGVVMYGGILEGTGVVNGDTSFLIGAVAPGTNGTIGTLTINGALGLSLGSTTLIDITNNTTDVLAVNGDVALGGTLMPEPLTTPHWHDTHVFLTATGAVTGSFDEVADTFVGLLYPKVTQQVVGGVTQEVLTVEAETFAQFMGGAGTPDQKAIAGALDALRGSHYDDLAPIYQALDTLSDGALIQAIGNFETLAPDTERAAPLVEDMIQSNLDSMIWQRLYQVGGTPDDSKSAGLSINAEGLKMALVSAGGTSPGSQQLVAMGMGIATNPGAGNAMPGTGAAVSPNDASDTWMDLPAGLGGFLSGSALNGSVEVGGGGGRAKVNGLVIAGGLDIAAGGGLTVGVSFGYSDATATLLSRPAVLQTNAIQGAVYGRYDFGNDYILEGFASYGHQTIQSRRIAIVGATSYDLSGHTGGDSPSVGGYFGRTFRFDASDAAFKIVPSVSLQYAEADVDAFSETGGAPALTFDSYGERTILSRLGFDAQTTFDLDMLHITPNFHGFWVNNFGHANAIDAAFAAAPSSIMTFEMAPRQHSYAELGGGLDFDLGDVLGTDATLSARYDAQTREDVSYGAWTGRLSIKF
ncbi:MAG: autotransporter domain-containing protein [Rhizomicrobium sp.]